MPSNYQIYWNETLSAISNFELLQVTRKAEPKDSHRKYICTSNKVLPQLVVFFPVLRACMKLDMCSQDAVIFRMQMCLGICI
jgi:hypothetical protein